MSFESDLKRMEEITEMLKNDSTGLEKSIELYKEASELGKKLNATLTEIQRQVQSVTGTDENEFATEDFEEND